MTNFLIACDHKDPGLGQFLNDILIILCERCELLGNDFNTELVDTDSYLAYPLVNIIQSFNSSPFLFLVLAHGSDNAVFINDAEIINISNSDLFNKSFFYAISCSTAVNLGPALIENGCKTYIGYNDEVTIILPYQDIFKNCQIFGIEKFINDKITSNECFQQMIEKYNTEIDELYNEDAFAASYLLANRASLEIKGELNCYLSDFSI